MTHPKSTDLLPVSQADRNAVVRLLESGGQDWQAKEVRIGDGDHFPIVQAFARHRISHASVARKDDVERVAKAIAIADVPLPNETAWANDDFLSETGRQNYRVQARAAILALLPASPAQAAKIDPSFLNTAAHIIAEQINPEPWWWSPRFDDGHEPIANRLRAENLSAVDAIIEAGLPYMPAALTTPDDGQRGEG